MIKLEANKGYIEGEINGSPITVASELTTIVRTVREFLEESVEKEIGDHLAKRSCEIAFMSREELKAEREESEKRMAEEFKKFVEGLFEE